MTRSNMFASFIVASLLATAPAIAGPWDGHPELGQSILNNLDKPAYVGTSMAARQPRIDAYQGGFARNPDLDQSGFVVGAAGPERGYGDNYGWVVYDLVN